MKPTLFKDMKAENWPSMNRYYRSLVDQFKSRNISHRVFCVEPPLANARTRMFWRSSVYPFLAQFYQGSVNHILDHSYGHLLNYLEPSKTVVTCHDLIPLEYERDAVALNQFRKSIAGLNKARLIMADSQATQKDLIQKLGIAEDKIEVVYLGVEEIFKPVASPPEKEKLRQKLSLPAGPIILSVGNCLAYKNLEGVLQALRLVLNERPDCFLLRVGDWGPTLRSLVRNLGLQNHHRVMGRVSDTELVEVYNAVDVYLSPSFKEGFGLPTLEALACGLPVIVSAGTSLAEIAGEIGIYVDPIETGDIAAVILKVLADGPLEPRRKEAFVERARQFTWGETARQTLEVYEKVLKGVSLVSKETP